MGFGFGGTSLNMGPRGMLAQFSGPEARGQLFNRRVLKRLLTYLRPYQKQMWLAFAAMLGVTGLSLLTPYLLKVSIDQYIGVGVRLDSCESVC